MFDKKICDMAYRMDREGGHCLECGEKMGYGRTDRKFCCSACKNKYNNRRIRNERIVRLRTDSAIERNYRILSHLLEMNVCSAGIRELEAMGFKREYSTGFHQSRGHLKMCCYDIEYKVSENKIYGIGKILPQAEGRKE